MKKTEPKLARRSFGEPYECKKDWGKDCFVQCGDNGMVFKKGTFNKVMNDTDTAVKALTGELKHYKTAFFEAFPPEPNKTFIRGEGKTVEEAEEDAWKQFVKISKCKHKKFERKNHTNGAGFCIKCGMFKS